MTGSAKWLVVLLIAAVLNIIAQGSTQGVQELEFLGKSGSVFWIGEDIGGEYRVSRLLTVGVNVDKAVTGVSVLEGYKEWEPVKKLMGNLETEPVVRLKRNQGKLYCSNDGWYIAPSEEDPNMAQRFRKHIRSGGSNGESWNKREGLAGVCEPTGVGIEMRMVHYYRRGLYIDYQLDKGWYFPRSGKVLVFTRQEQMGVGGDSMDGFMILSLFKAN